MSAAPERSSRGSRAANRWLGRSLTVFLIGALIVAVIVGFWSASATLPVVADKTGYFAAVMRVVRPVILLVLLALWCPVFRWLRDRSRVTVETSDKAERLWPRLVVWVGLIELTIGQGLVVIGLIALAAYWFFFRRMIEP